MPLPGSAPLQSFPKRVVGRMGFRNQSFFFKVFTNRELGLCLPFDCHTYFPQALHSNPRLLGSLFRQIFPSPVPQLTQILAAAAGGGGRRCRLCDTSLPAPDPSWVKEEGDEDEGRASMTSGESGAGGVCHPETVFLSPVSEIALRLSRSQAISVFGSSSEVAAAAAGGLGEGKGVRLALGTGARNSGLASCETKYGWK